ncbi:hypothetical protein Lal_00011186 [Lupinus albus]|nr:hypothetical protein Lal_00011186 [Lupinus albus]
MFNGGWKSKSHVLKKRSSFFNATILAQCIQQTPENIFIWLTPVLGHFIQYFNGLVNHPCRSKPPHQNNKHLGCNKQRVLLPHFFDQRPNSTKLAHFGQNLNHSFVHILIAKLPASPQRFNTRSVNPDRITTPDSFKASSNFGTLE